MDDIDKIQAQWAKQRSDLDTKPMALIGRLGRLSRIHSIEMEKTFTQFGLNGATFDMLATLLRSGSPHRLSPNQLLETMMITSGTLTNRIDRLEDAGLISRCRNMEDKRSVVISLTEKGRTIIDKAIAAHVDTQARLVSGMSETERTKLNSLLKKYLDILS